MKLNSIITPHHDHLTAIASKVILSDSMLCSLINGQTPKGICRLSV